MADIDLGNLNQFEISSYEEGLVVVQELEEEFIKLGKKIKKAMKSVKEMLSRELWSQVKSMGAMLMDAFRVESLEDYYQAAAIYGSELAGALYQVQLSFGGLKVAVINAAAPIVQVLLPVVQTAIEVLTKLAQCLGQVLRMLFLGTAEAEDYSAGISGAVSASNSLKRSLAGFDQINRLNGKSSSSGGFLGISSLTPLSGGWKKLADKLTELLEPLKKIDLTPAAESLERLRKALEPITMALFEALEWAWYNIFVPLAQWAVEELLPVFLDSLTAALEALARVIEELKPYFTWLWEECLKPLAEWKGNQLIEYLKGITDELSGVSDWITVNQDPVDGLISSGKVLIETIGKLAQETVNLSGMTEWASKALSDMLLQATLSQSPLQGVSGVIGILTQGVGQLADVFGVVTSASDGAWASMKNIWENAWSEMKNKLMDPSYSGVRKSINSIIGLVNSVLSGVTSGVNFISRALNGLSFEVPSWVPLIGGKSFTFSLKTLTAPQIPYLAKGAVLPANRPFMAVVGDQKHGTNIEAPLATIQEAVAAVMQDYAASNLAGHEATVAVLQELLAAVLGIQIGDEAIAAAVDRYDRKMAVVRGGYV